jgi:hypothetical protein
MGSADCLASPVTRKTNEWLGCLKKPMNGSSQPRSVVVANKQLKKSLLETVVDSNSNKKTLLSLLSFQICVP